MKIFTISILLIGLFTALGLRFPSGDPLPDAAQQIAQAYTDNFLLFQKETDKLAEKEL